MLNGYGPWLLFSRLDGRNPLVTWRRVRGRPRGRDGVPAVDRLDDAGLVECALQGLPDVELPDHEPHLRVVEVGLGVGDAEEVERLQVVGAAQRVGGRQDRVRRPLRQVGRGDIADVELPGLQRGVLGRVSGVGQELDRRQLRLGAARVGLVRHDRHVARGAEAGQLPRPVNHRPQRAGRVGRGDLRLRGQEGVDGLALGPVVGRAVGDAAAAARLAAQAGDVPGHRHRLELAQLVVGEPDAGVGLVELEGHLVGPGGLVGHQVVRQQALRVAVPVGLLRLGHVQEEDQALGVDGLAVGPLPALHVDHDGLAAVAVLGGLADDRG